MERQTKEAGRLTEDRPCTYCAFPKSRHTVCPYRTDTFFCLRKTGDGGFFDGEDLWVDPPLANWGLNIHAIDLRDVGNTRNAVQCSCAYYGKTNPGTPQQFDRSPRRGGGIECCGAQARGPVLKYVLYFPNPTTVYCPSLTIYCSLHASQVDCLPIQYTQD